MPRADNRPDSALRPVRMETSASRHAEGSCLIAVGHTRVLCTATVEDSVPPFLRHTGRGWVTAEYGMLPRATNVRNDRRRTAAAGRTLEIQRLIGRALRAVTRLDGFGERQVRVDCDVLQADGGTRTAAITGGWVALALAFEHLQALGVIPATPLTGQVAAVSCGLCDGKALLDLDYGEDANAGADANFVLTDGGELVEVQATAEGGPFSEAALTSMLALARTGAAELARMQRAAVEADKSRRAAE